MKKLMSLLFLGFLLLVIGCEKDLIFDDPLDPETKVAFREDVDPALINQAIEDGIAWMLTQQDPSGFFSSSTNEGVARTALAVTKLCDRAVEDGFTPQNHPDYGGPTGPIARGLDFILANATLHGEGGIILNAGPPGHDVYNTGIAMMALAAYRCPDCALDVGVGGVDTYKKLLDKNVEFFEDIQNPDGGWRYWDNYAPSDNSNTGFAALGLLAAQEFGCDVSEDLKSNLSVYINFIQNVNGGSGYTGPNNWVNTMKTGNLLFEMALVGDTPESPRAELAVYYLVNNWNAPSGMYGGTPGWKPDNWLAMYCMMKGAVSIGLDDFEGIDWFNEFAGAIVSQQQAGGYWNPAPWIDEYLSTVFNLLTLEKIAPQAFIEVGFDIKPTSCPNPFNQKSKGVVPMAILGAEDFDVNEINLATVNIEDITPVKSSYEDVATPYIAGPEGLDDKMDCTTEGADGFMDLVIHFKTQELATLLTDYGRDDVVVLTIQGELNDGRVFQGQDIVVIVSKK